MKIFYNFFDFSIIIFNFVMLREHLMSYMVRKRLLVRHRPPYLHLIMILVVSYLAIC